MYNRRKCFYNKDKYKAVGTLKPSGYVEDDLIAWFDGEYNTSNGIHDNSASTWFDLTGNGYDLSKNTNKSDSYFIDNGFHYTETAGNSVFYLSSDQSHPTDAYGIMAVEIVFEIKSNSNAGTFVLWDTYKDLGSGTAGNTASSANHYDSNDYGYYTVITGDNKLQVSGQKYYQSISRASDPTLQINKKYYLYRQLQFPYITTNTNLKSILKTGESTSTQISLSKNNYSSYATGSFAYNNSKICLFSSRYRINPPNTMAATGSFNVYALRYYLRPLTDAEITQNYNRDKERFNIS